VRKEPEILELRQWQREWREENENVKYKVDNFWKEKMPCGDAPTPNASEEVITEENKDILVMSPSEKQSN
jgi:hypothetical protein